jgi:hypothetical protein
MFKRTCLAATLLMLVFSATSSRADDTSDIRASGKAFAEALHDGDALNAKKYAFTDETSDKALDVMTELTHARKKLIDAAVDKFGDEGKNVVVGGASMARTQAVSTDFDGAKIDVHGDTATVASKDGADKRPAVFRKVSGIWKINLTKLADFTSITRNAAMMHNVSRSFLTSADEISGGKYKSVQEAKTAVQRNMVTAIGGTRRGG